MVTENRKPKRYNFNGMTDNEIMDFVKNEQKQINNSHHLGGVFIPDEGNDGYLMKRYSKDGVLHCMTNKYYKILKKKCRRGGTHDTTQTGWGLVRKLGKDLYGDGNGNFLCNVKEVQKRHGKSGNVVLHNENTITGSLFGAGLDSGKSNSYLEEYQELVMDLENELNNQNENKYKEVA